MRARQGEGLEVVRSAAVRRCQSAGATAEEAEDSVHDALLSLLESPDAAPVHKPGAWVATVSHRRWVDHVRRGARERMVLRRDHAMKNPDVDPAEVVADRDQAHWLVASLKGLPKTTQEICWAVGRGMSRDEVAEDFGLTARSVESHLTRARRLIRGLRIVVLVPVVTVVDRVLRRWPGLPEVAAVAMPVAVCVAVTMAPPPMAPTSPPGLSVTVEAPSSVPVGDIPSTSSRPGPAPPAPAVSAPPLPVPATSAPPTREGPPATTASPAAESAKSAAPTVSAPSASVPSASVPGVSGPNASAPIASAPNASVPSVSVLIAPAPSASVPKLPVKPLLSSLPTIPALPPILPRPVAPGQIIGSVIDGIPGHLPLPLRGQAR